MREYGIDLFMLWNDRSIRYFTAHTSTHSATPSMPPVLAIVPVDEDPVAVTGEFFLSAAEIQTWIQDIPLISRGYAWSEETLREFPVEVAAIVRGIGHGTVNIALEMAQLGNTFIARPLNDIRTLMRELPEANFVDGDKAILRCRQVKPHR